MKVLFLCNQNKHRSKTAEDIFSKEHETKSKGIYVNKPSNEDLMWADIIIVMEEHQRNFIAEHFPKEYLSKRILNLDIPDVYSYGQKKLINELNTKFHQAISQIV